MTPAPALRVMCTTCLGTGMRPYTCKLNAEVFEDWERCFKCNGRGYVRREAPTIGCEPGAIR